MNTTTLDNTLRATARLVRLHAGLRAVGLALVALIIAVVAAVTLDALFGLPPVGLLVVDVMLIAVAVAAIIFIILRIARESFDRRQMARLIEDRLALNHSDLINAVQLAEGSHDGTSAALRDATIARGVQFAATLDPARIIDKRPAFTALSQAAFALLLVGVAFLLVPSVFRTTLARYLDPYGDLPPFTLVNFHFDHPDEVYEGQPAHIRVKLTGSNLPEQANIVFISETGDTEVMQASVPMVREDSSELRVPGSESKESNASAATPDTRHPIPEFVLPIDKADRTRVFYVSTSAGRSEKRTINVLPVPRFESVTVTYEPPAYTGWQQTTEHLNSKGIRALHGTKATITVKSNLPLEAGELRQKFEGDPQQIPWGELPPDFRKNYEVIRTPGQNGGFTYPALKDRGDSALQRDHTTSAYGKLGLMEDLKSIHPDVVILKPLPNDPTVATVILDLKQSTSFRLELIAANAQRTRSLTPVTGKIEVLPDAPPRIAILEPTEKQSIAPVGWKIPVIIEAEDDVKINRITLFHRVADGASTQVTLPLIARSASHVQAKYEIDLAALNAKAGDTITFFATAHDNCPASVIRASAPASDEAEPAAPSPVDSDPESPVGQSTDTETYTIHVISLEDYQNHARSQYQMEEILAEIDRFDRLLKELDAQRDQLLAEVQALEKKIADQGGSPTPEDEKTLAELNDKLAKYAEDQWKLAKEMRDRAEQPALYDFERAYAQMLAEQADELDRGAEDATKLKRENEFNRSENPQDKAEAMRHLKQMAQQLKRDEERLDEAQQQAGAAQQDMALIDKADRIMQESQRMTSIIEAQRDLANRLAPFKDKSQLTPAEEIRAQRLAMEQQALKEELEQTLKALDEASKNAENDLPKMAQSAREIAQKIREMNVPADQSGAEQSARQGEGAKAHALADAAATKLESMLGQCEATGEQGSQDFADASFQLQKQSLGQGLQQLSQGRKLPQLGPGKPGSSTSNNPGQTGMAGMKGSQGKFSIYGPRSTGQSGAERRGGRDGTGKGTATGADESHSAAAESLSPESATQRGTGATAIPGVPARYRDLAEQYFRRLAEEAK